MELYVIRHGKTDWNKECRFQGAKDIDLNEEGREVAGRLGERLESVHFDMIFSSPLSRAYETACLIRGHRNIQIIKDQLIKEISFGSFEGLPFDDWMNTDHPRKYFFDAPEKYAPPEGGETFEHAMERTKQFLKEVLEPAYEKFPDGRIMVVAHGAILAAFMSVIENRDLAHFWGTGLKGNCEETIYNFDGKNWTLVSQAEKPQENPYVASTTGKKA